MKNSSKHFYKGLIIPFAVVLITFHSISIFAEEKIFGSICAKNELAGDSTKPGEIIKNAKPVEQKNYFETWVATIGSTDPGGLGYHPVKNCLLLSDSEINEYGFYGRGNNSYNIFLVSLDGKKTLSKYAVGRMDSIKRKFFAEPTGIIYNANDNYYYVSNDDEGTIVQYDSVFQTTGFTVNLREMKCGDAEGLAYDKVNDEYYVCSGNGGSREIFVFNGNFKLNRKFSVVTWIDDPEGLSFDPISRHLFIVAGGDDNLILEFSPAGQYIAEYSINDLHPKPIHIDAITVVPGQNPDKIRIFLGDRGIDNNIVPPGSYSEDGRIYEILINP